MKYKAVQNQKQSTLSMSAVPHPVHPVSVLRTKHYCEKAKVSRAWLLDRMNKNSKNYDSSMPPRLWLSGIQGKGPVGFLESEVDAWILSRAVKSQPACNDSNIDGMELAAETPHKTATTNTTKRRERTLDSAQKDQGQSVTGENTNWRVQA